MCNVYFPNPNFTDYYQFSNKNEKNGVLVDFTHNMLGYTTNYSNLCALSAYLRASVMSVRVHTSLPYLRTNYLLVCIEILHVHSMYSLVIVAKRDLTTK